MNWRAWAYSVISSHPSVQEVVGERVYGSGSLTTSPETHPFIVITFLPSIRPGPGRSFKTLQVWAHDRSRSYVRVDNALDAVREALEGASAEDGFIGATWEGNGADLFDDAMNTRTRTATFRLAAKELIS